jgi:hypothetical protein
MLSFYFFGNLLRFRLDSRREPGAFLARHDEVDRVFQVRSRRRIDFGDVICDPSTQTQWPSITPRGPRLLLVTS